MGGNGEKLNSAQGTCSILLEGCHWASSKNEPSVPFKNLKKPPLGFPRETTIEELAVIRTFQPVREQWLCISETGYFIYLEL
jgi:hypothetical protein